MDNEILELLKQMQKDQQEMKADTKSVNGRLEGIETDIESINGRLDRIESDIKDIKLHTNSIKINIKETREDTRRSELATAQNSFEIEQIKMRMKMT